MYYDCMNTRILIASLTLGIVSLALGMPATASETQTSTFSMRAVQEMQGNADAAASNGAHYLWRRVDLEVERITAKEHEIEMSIVGDTNLQQQTKTLQIDVLALRSARFSQDAERTQDAARQVAAQCALLASRKQ
jgi:hypothetical protein